MENAGGVVKVRLGGGQKKVLDVGRGKQLAQLRVRPGSILLDFAPLFAQVLIRTPPTLTHFLTEHTDFSRP